MVVVEDVIKNTDWDLFDKIKEQDFVLYEIGETRVRHQVKVDFESISHSEEIIPIAYGDNKELEKYAILKQLKRIIIKENPFKNAW